MRVAMILRPDADRVFGGDTVVMRKLSAALQARGVDVSLDKQDDLPPAREFDLLHIFALAPLDHARRMVAWAQAGRAAVVFTPLYYNDYRDWFALALSRTSRWATVARLLGRRAAWQVFRAWQTARQPAQAPWRGMREALLAADMIATSSRWENAFLAGHFRFAPDARSKMGLVRFGIDTELYGRRFCEDELSAFRAKYGLATGYVVEVARIESKKNQLALIQALWDDPVDLVFVGSVSPYFEPDYADRCRAAAARRGRVHFLGWLPKDELPLAYAAAGAHALPSWNELPGLSSLEAGASGTRVISTQYSGLPEMLGNMAAYCDPFDLASIRSAVRSALAAPVPAGLRDDLLRKYSWDEAARAGLALYEKVLRPQSVAAAA